MEGSRAQLTEELWLVRWVISTPVGKLLRSLKKQKKCEEAVNQKNLLKVVQDFVHHCYWQSQWWLSLLTDTDMLQCWSVAFIVQLGWSWLVIIALKNTLNTCAGAAASAAPTPLHCPVGGSSDQSPHTLNTCRAFFRQCAKWGQSSKMIATRPTKYDCCFRINCYQIPVQHV